MVADTVLVGVGEADVVEQAEEDVLGVWLPVPVPLCVGVGVEVGLGVGLWEPGAEEDTVDVVEMPVSVLLAEASVVTEAVEETGDAAGV